MTEAGSAASFSVRLEPSGRLLAVPAGGARRGYVRQPEMQDFADLAQAQVCACGSEAMVESARRQLVDGRGLPQERFFADAFSPGA